MNNKIKIRVHKINDKDYLEKFNPNETLDQFRIFLSAQGIMSDNDRFFSEDAEIQKNLEKSFSIEEVLVEGVITVGKGSGADRHQDSLVDLYDNLSSSEKADLLYDKCAILNGLRIQIRGNDAFLIKDTKPCIQQLSPLPRGIQPQLSEREEIYVAFSQVDHQMNTQGIDKGSLSVTTPFGGGGGTYDHEKKHKETESSVHAYFLCKQFLPKVYVSLDQAKIVPTTEFVDAIQGAINTGGPNGYAKLCQILVDYGAYVPLKYTIGGAQCAESTFDYNSKSEAESEATSFGASVNASYRGFGGGGSYYHGEQVSTFDGQVESKFSIQTSVIGGNTGKALDLTTPGPWIESLGDANLWRVVYQEDMIPTLAVIAKTNPDLFNEVVGLIDRNLTTEVDVDPHVIMAKYSLALSTFQDEGGW